MKLLKTWMTALCLAFAVLLMQGGTALAALYQGDIGETRFTTPEGTYILKRYAPPQGGAYGASSSSGSSGGGEECQGKGDAGGQGGQDAQRTVSAHSDTPGLWWGNQGNTAVRR